MLIYDFSGFNIISVPFPPPPLARPCPSPRGSAASTLRLTITLITAEGAGFKDYSRWLQTLTLRGASEANCFADCLNTKTQATVPLNHYLCYTYTILYLYCLMSVINSE